MADANTTPDQGDERRAFVQWLGNTFPHSYDEKDAEHYWQHGHVSALAWQARSAIAAPQPVAQEPSQGAEEALALGLKTRAFQDVVYERMRQCRVEGWTPMHDDEHTDGSLSVAAACYALAELNGKRPSVLSPLYLWKFTGWDESWWKPAGRRRNLVKAGALILAELERLDRADGTFFAAAPHRPVSAESGKGFRGWSGAEVAALHQALREAGLMLVRGMNGLRIEKTLKGTRSESVAVSAAPSALPAQAVGEKVTDEQIVATAREKQKRLAHWDYDDLVSFTRAVLALAAPMPQPEEVGNLEYMGNSVSWWHAKAKAYGDAVSRMHQALTKAGYGALGGHVEVMLSAVLSAQPQPEPTSKGDMIEVVKEDANNYSRILTLLGMEEEGDPVAEVQRLVEADVVRQRIAAIEGLYAPQEAGKPACAQEAAEPATEGARAVYVADLLDTFEQLRQILGTPEQDADALIATVRRLAAFDSPQEAAEREAQLQEAREQGWRAAIDVHSRHGMAGWSSHKDAALSAPQEAGKPACDRCDGRRLVEEGDPESGGNKVPCPVCCGQEASKAFELSKETPYGMGFKDGYAKAQEAGKLAATEIDLPTDHDVLEHCDQNGTTLAEAAFALAKPSKEAGKVEPVAHIDSAKIEALKDTAYVDAVLSTRALPFTVPVYLRPTQQALSDAQKRKLVGNYFADDWAVKAALSMLGDYPAILAAAGGSFIEEAVSAAPAVDKWQALYRRMREVAAGYSNLAEETGSSRRLDKEFEAIEQEARNA